MSFDEEKIEKFIETYGREFDHYFKVAQIAKEICEEVFKDNGVRAIVTHRAKSINSLRDKVRRRRDKANYTCDDDI